MVTTRGKKINFSADGSDGEPDDVELEVPAVKRASKRRKPNKSNVKDDDTAFEPSSSATKGKGKAVPEQPQLITRRGGRGGKLRDLMNMPIDIFAEVCSYLEPFDIRRLALTSQRLWEILMTKESRAIWKRALNAVPGLPPCPNDLNEPQYVWLLFSSECQTTGCSGRGTRADWYHRVRYCADCYEVEMTNNWLLSYNGQIQSQFDSDTLSVVQKYFDSNPVMRRTWVRAGTKKDEKHFRLSTLKRATAGYDALSTPEERAEWLTKLKDDRDYRVSTGKAMREWKSKQMADRSKDIEEVKKARFESIKAKLLELGWEENDCPTFKKEFRDIAFKDQKLTPKIWQTILPKLEPLLHTERAERRERERQHRRFTREAAFRKFYNQARCEVVKLTQGVEHGQILPYWDDLLRIPSVKTMIEDDTETVTEAQLIRVGPDVRVFILKWWRGYLAKWVTAVDSGTMAGFEGESKSWLNKEEQEGNDEEQQEGDDEEEDAISAGIDALSDRLAYATSGLICRSSRCKRITWFPQAIQHHLAERNSYGIEWLRHHMEPFGAERKALVERMLKDLGFEKPETVRREEVAEEASEKEYLCTRCDERIAKYMTFEELITHYLDANTWYDQVTEAVRTNPETCHPQRALDNPLPTTINNHEWLSNDAQIVRKDAQATREAVLQLQTEFMKTELTDPACATEYMAKHSKEPDLETDLLTFTAYPRPRLLLRMKLML
ncbi:hypothetical protein FRB90_005826 [Tulasnella sp. 427]|nr:hypothetical protein FRB90_005826 [Tulasnella sp. 427]